MSDVRCTEKELQIFLTNNSNSLKHLEIQFSEFCIFPIAPHRGRVSTINVQNHIGYGGASVCSTHSSKSVKSTKSGSGSSSAHSTGEDTGFPDIAVLKRKHSKKSQLKRTKSRTQMRIMSNLNEIFNAILEYLNKGIFRLYEYNHRIRKIPNIEKKKNNSFDQQFSSSIAIPLNNFAVSFPTILMRIYSWIF